MAKKKKELCLCQIRSPKWCGDAGDVLACFFGGGEGVADLLAQMEQHTAIQRMF